MEPCVATYRMTYEESRRIFRNDPKPRLLRWFVNAIVLLLVATTGIAIFTGRIKKIDLGQISLFVILVLPLVLLGGYRPRWVRRFLQSLYTNEFTRLEFTPEGIRRTVENVVAAEIPWSLVTKVFQARDGLLLYGGEDYLWAPYHGFEQPKAIDELLEFVRARGVKVKNGWRRARNFEAPPEPEVPSRVIARVEEPAIEADDGEVITASYLWSAEEDRRSLRNRPEANWKARIIGSAFVLTGFGVGLWFISREHDLDEPAVQFSIAFIAVLTALMYAWHKFNRRRVVAQLDSRPESEKKIVYEFSQAGVKACQGGSGGVFSWKVFPRVVEGREGFLLYISEFPVRFEWVPYDAFEAQEHIEMVREFIKSNGVKLTTIAGGASLRKTQAGRL